MSGAKLATGADVGGTHITAAIIDLHRKKIVSSSAKRATVNAAGTADEIIKAWSDCIAAAKQNRDIESVCIAMPGPFDYKAGLCLMRGQAKYESLYGLNSKAHLAAALRLSPQAIFMDNDAAGFLQGEVSNGAVPEHDDQTVIGITLGTGLGSAVYKNGKSYSADMWRFPFKESIAEKYLSTPWFAGLWQEVTGTSVSGVKALSLLAETNSEAANIFNEFGHNLAEFLSSFIEKESASAVVIGGNISNAFKRFSPALFSVVRTIHSTVNIKQASLGEEAPLLSAVRSWLQQKTSALSLS